MSDVCVFDLNSGLFPLRGPLLVNLCQSEPRTCEDIDGENATDVSGRTVSISSDGNTVARGAAGNSDNGNDAGQIRVFDWNGTAWVQRGNDIDGEAAGDWFGETMSLSGDGTTVAGGALFNDGNGTNSGHTRIYRWNGTAWNKLGSDIDG